MRYFNSLKHVNEFKIDGDENISGVFKSSYEGNSLGLEESSHTHVGSLPTLAETT